MEDERYKEFIAQNSLSNSSGLLQVIQEYEAALEVRREHNLSEGKTMSEKTYAHFDNMAWPVPGERLDELEWRLRYGKITQEDSMMVASYLSAYRELTTCAGKKRESVVRQIKKHGVEA